MAYKLYQKLKSGMANQGIMDAEDVDVTEGGTRKTLKQKLSTFAPLPDNVTDNKQKVMKNGQWVEVVVPSNASEISYNGDVSGATNVAEAIDALAGDVADAIEASSAVQTAAGTEVGDVAQVEIPAGSIIWHDGQLYEVLALIAPGDHWEDMDVAPTTMSDQINALRGVSTEGVYLTVTPASAIPVEGVKARIYNVTSQTYLPEETITQNYNTVLLGQINYGDVYTIIMPEIEGYTKPADQTFKAGQLRRQRTVEYVDASIPNSEALVIKAKTSNNVAIGSYNAVVRLYDGQGAITQTINVSIEGGTSQVVNIPLGTKYSVTYPDISGYFTPKNQIEVLTASTANRYLNATYVYIPSGAYKWVAYDGNNIEYLDLDTDLTQYVANDTLFGVAYLSSSLVRSAEDGGDCRFILPFDMVSLGNKKWSSPVVDVPSVQNIGGRSSTNPNMYNGASNSATILDAILQYEVDNNIIVESVFKDISQGITLGGVTVKLFIPAWQQISIATGNRATLNNILTRFGSSKSIPALKYAGYTSLQANATEAYKFVDGYDGAFAKTSASSAYAFLPIISVTQN